MKDSGEHKSRRSGGFLLASARNVGRYVRGGVKQMAPRLVLHNLRWHAHRREYLAQWTERRLQFDGFFWLFILGLNNSGTTLLVDLLKSHPALRWLPNEGQYLTRALPLPRSHGLPRNFSQRLDIFHWTEANDPAPALRVQYDWSLYFQQRPGILMEKSPPNTLRSRWLQQNFRPSRFVAIIRHPYAVCEGVRRRTGHSIEDAALHWVRAHECLLDDIEHLQYCLCFRYEDLCQQSEHHLHQLEAFLGLETPIDQSVLTTPRNIHNIDAAPQLIRNLNDKSLAQLSAADIGIIDRVAGPLMERLEYKPLQQEV